MASLYPTYTYPYSDVQIKDSATSTSTAEVTLPVHRPFFPLRAAKGTPNVIGWYTGSEAIAEFGEETWTIGSEFYRNEQTFMEGLFNNQGCFIVRLCDEEAATASAVLEAYVTKDVEIPQYQRDEYGGIIEDENGAYVPLTDVDGNPVIELGVSIKHQIRTLDESETIKTILPRTVVVGETTTTIYPLIAFQVSYPGSAGNRGGFRFYYDYSEQNDTVLEENKCLVFNFVPVEQEYNEDTVSIIKTVYGTSYVSFAMKPAQTNSDTSLAISMDATITRNYESTSSTTGDVTSSIPYSMYQYADYFKLIGDIVLGYESNDDGTLADGWMVDIISATNTSGYPYNNLVIDSDSVNLTKLHTHYLDGGSDGDLSDDKFESLVRQLMTSDIVPEATNTDRYHITHIYDVGYSLDTKYSFAEFMVNQKRCKAIMAAQINGDTLLTMEESIAVASSLLTRFRMTPESELYGTGALRAEIFGHAGYLTDTAYTNIIPFTYWSLLKRTQYQSGQSITNTYKGYPNNLVTQFRTTNYVPYTPAQKQLLWNSNLNYVQYRGLTTLFFPDVVSIYSEQSSVLMDSTYTDVCVQTMYILDDVWADHSGKTIPFGTLKTLVVGSINTKCSQIFGLLFPLVTTTMEQTDEDISNGDSFHIETEVMGYNAARRFISTINATRENL